MRIAHVITRMILGGAQENTLLCCQGLARDHGHEVLLITGPEAGPEGSLLSDAEERGVSLRMIPQLGRAIHPTQDWAARRELERVIREFRPEVVHTHSAKGGFLGRLAAWKANVPAVVHTVHGAPFHPYQSAAARKLFQACERYAAARCHKLVSVCDAMTELMVKSDIAPREKFVTVYSGFEVDAFLKADEHRESTRAELGFTKDHVVIGKIARLFHLKGHADVIAAAKQVVARHPQVRFLLVGDGILRDNLQSKIKQGGLTEYFRFAGLVPRERIPAMIGAMDFLVHASLREGLARALPQALIAGKPAVSYDIDGAREVVLPGETGMLVPPKSIEGLAEAMSTLASDRGLRARYGARGKELFAEQFRHERMTKQLSALYAELLGNVSSGENG